MSELFSNIDYSKFYNEIGEEEKLKQEIMDNNKEERLDNNEENKNLKEKLKKEIKKRNSKED